MARHFGGSLVHGGYYWNPKAWSVTPIPDEGGMLPGDHADGYVKIPILAALALMPIVGGLFVVFVPLIGFGLTFYAIARKLAGGAKKGAEELAATVAPGWVPGEAHLTGKRADKEGEKGEPAKDEALDKLSKEIDEKRGDKRGEK